MKKTKTIKKGESLSKQCGYIMNKEVIKATSIVYDEGVDILEVYTNVNKNFN